MPLISQEQLEKKNLASALFTGLSEPSKRHMPSVRTSIDNVRSENPTNISTSINENLMNMKENLLLDFEV